ncbi:zinc ribbon domain-containing protein [Alienimonas sp. DA493]|uniref:zinc ribbon domain-containing protein n=1 Tax=Alienimonas sp. DA493 TaxID=3373605 RepID=UPI003753E9BA
MTETAAGLSRLHSVHRDIARVREELARGPRQVRARRKAIKTKEEEIAALKEKRTALKKSADAKNLQLRTNEEKILGLKAKLNQASSNEVFAALRKEIDADVASNAVLEDEILETLDRVDAVGKEIEEAEADRDKRSADADALEKKVAEERAGLEAELAALEKRLEQSESIIPAKLQVDYRRLVEHHGANAMAPVEDRVCTSCQTTVSPQQKVQLNMGEFVFCRSCGRLLYRGDDAGA